MTKKQKQQFNKMLRSLKLISKHYHTPDQLRRMDEKGKGQGPSYQETLEMAYENIQNEAKYASKGLRFIEIEK